MQSGYKRFYANERAAQIAEIQASDLQQLKTQVEEAENQERDLLEEIAAQVKRQIDEAKRRLAAVTAKGMNA